MVSTIKYPPYKQVQHVEQFIRTGSIILPGEEIKRKTMQILEIEGFPIHDENLEEFITLSFQDVIEKAVTYGDNGTHSIMFIQNLCQATWKGTTTWLMDYADMLLQKPLADNPFGIWEVRFVHGDLYIVKVGDFATMMYGLLKSNGALPSREDVITFGVSEDVETCTSVDAISEAVENAKDAEGELVDADGELLPAKPVALLSDMLPAPRSAKVQGHISHLDRVLAGLDSGLYHGVSGEIKRNRR